jgi:hypothetical protein
MLFQYEYNLTRPLLDVIHRAEYFSLLWRHSCTEAHAKQAIEAATFVGRLITNDEPFLTRRR